MTMRYPTTLAVAERVVRVLLVMNLFYGTGVLALLIVSIAAPDLLLSALVGKPVKDTATTLRDMRLLMAVGITAVPLAHVILVRVRDMLLSVHSGDPFVTQNARRLDDIAIAVLVMEVIHLAVGMIIRGGSFMANGIHIAWSFSFTPWLAVLLLFVLARVFDQGARMRADLEGTV